MSFLTRISNGWTIAMNSFAVLKKNKQLLIFPVLSGISMFLIVALIATGFMAAADWNLDEALPDIGGKTNFYLFSFLFYLVNYFVVVFFNMALIHCTKLYLDGEEPTVAAGIRFSLSRIGTIFSWAMFAATIGTILRMIQEEAGWLGKIAAGILGFAWGIATFLVVPVIAYENLGPVGAFKRSAALMKQKWGESLGATFSLGLIQLVGILGAVIPGLIIGSLIHPFAGMAVGALCVLFVLMLISAAQTVFVGLVYLNINGNVQDHVDQHLVDSLFQHK